jgi:hypothetical protein
MTREVAQDTAELATLRLGGENAAVLVREQSERPQKQTASPEVNTMADAMYHDFEKGQPWLKETFFGKSGPDILQAVRLFCQKVNFNRTEGNQHALNILQLADVVTQQSKSLASPLQILCDWTVLVRIGVRKLQRDLLGLIAMVPMPPQGSVRLAQPADSVGKTHYVITHLLGEKFLCRGYAMYVTHDGDWVLGGADGNRWHKDLWLTPGIQSVEAIVAAKRRKIEPSGRKANDKEASFVKRTLAETRSRLEKTRAIAGLKAENFGAAHGARLDLENKPIMQAALSCVRAMIAQVLSTKEDQVLDEISGRQGHTKAAIAQDPTLAGTEEAAFRHHLERRDHANEAHRACGRFVIPQGFMVFASQSVPATIPDEIRTEVAGVAGIAVSAEDLAGFDYGQLKRSPAALSDVEDLTPLIDACGYAVVNGQAILNMEPVQEEGGAEYMRYYVAGQDPAEMPAADFLKRAYVKFVPMVIRCKRRRMFPEDMQGSQRGVYFAMSFEDVAERFVPCKHQHSSTRSEQSNS